MTGPRVQVTFLCDEDVPDSIVEFLRMRGHRVFSVKHSTFESEPDDVITRLGDEISKQYGAEVVIVTFNHKHFLTRISRRPPDNQLRFRALGRLSIKCLRPIALRRLKETIEDVEREYQICSTRNDKRVIMTLDDNYFSVER